MSKKEEKKELIQYEIEQLSKIQLFNPHTGRQMYSSSSVNSARKKILDLKIELDKLENPPKALTYSDIVDALSQNNGQVRKCDAEKTSTKKLKELIKATDDVEKQALLENPDLYSDKNGGGPASFYHMRSILKKALDSK